MTMARDRSKAVKRTPGFDCLEGRELLSAPKNVPRAFLFTPIAETAPLAEHIHPLLTIVVNGQSQTIPAGIGIQANGALPIHTHDTSGIIHIESTQKLPFRLRDIFTVWDQPFSKKNILGHTADKTHKVTMTVNGRASTAFGSLLLKDLQDIVIRYVTVGRKPRY